MRMQFNCSTSGLVYFLAFILCGAGPATQPTKSTTHPTTEALYSFVPRDMTDKLEACSVAAETAIKDRDATKQACLAVVHNSPAFQLQSKVVKQKQMAVEEAKAKGDARARISAISECGEEAAKLDRIEIRGLSADKAFQTASTRARVAVAELAKIRGAAEMVYDKALETQATEQRTKAEHEKAIADWLKNPFADTGRVATFLKIGMTKQEITEKLGRGPKQERSKDGESFSVWTFYRPRQASQMGGAPLSIYEIGSALSPNDDTDPSLRGDLCGEIMIHFKDDQATTIEATTY